jgi:hypothetical protein
MKTQITLWLLTAILSVGLAPQGLGSTNVTVAVSPAGWRVVAPGFGEDQPRPFNYPSGLELALLMESRDQPIVKINAADCALTALTDNRGTALLRERSPFHLRPTISPDGRRAMLEIRAGAPARGAVEITASGEVSLVVGGKIKTYEAKDASLVKGPVAAEGLKASLLEVGRWGSAGTRLNIRIEGKAAAFWQGITFLGTDGKPLSATFQGQGLVFYGAGEAVQIREVSYVVPSETKMATIQFNVWSETDVLRVPFHFTTGIGL